MNRCGDCAHGEAHGFSHQAIKNNYPMTIYFWCPLKEHHDVTREACEEYKQGETKIVYDDIDW